ncbi:pentapeptide repeat-containing protein [Paenibacillus dokdonensis]|uniref:Pentapeptide repeat-containing protein n=1 Tax=Paenibacillus dokdonensis TaxID=2567944 RepID=A0ABU6GT21_9BACL|nr:pentapeptide repeat-containing protein [Paenibacillus dokdonensis]MEC0242563.1 pentapeptide repeat-containing protein [Paenibacillus dokdonensis]
MSRIHEYSDHPPDRSHLHADCENCFGLCCAALPFSSSSDFAFDKDAGTPCQNLRTDFRCSVHDSLRQRGMRGCTVYDCFGAGQKVSQITYEGRDWRQAPDTAKQMFGVFPIMWQLHELLWYLTEALTLQHARPIFDDLRVALEETDRLTQKNPESLLEINISIYRAEINTLLLRTSELVREDARNKHKGSLGHTKKIQSRGADLIGAKLRNADLRYQSFRGAYLIAADLSGADLRVTDLIGADLRDADLKGADLTGSIFLTQAQINSAKGDAGTKLPSSLTRPSHWITAQ